MKMLPLMLGALALAACVSDRTNGDSLDEIAKDYVQMTLELGEREPGYVDAYYGPAPWADAAKANPRGSTALAAGAADLIRRLNLAPASAKDSASRSEEHTSELQSLMRISYAVFCLKKKTNTTTLS